MDSGQEASANSMPPVLRVLQSKEETRAFYDKISKVYDHLAERSEEPMRRVGLRKLAAKGGENVLEIGFGTGHCLVELARAVGAEGQVHGIDLSAGMLNQARELLEKQELFGRVNLILGDAESLPFNPRSLDAIFMSFTLELFDTPEIPKLLRECRRALRPGGRLVVVGMSKEERKGKAGDGWMVKAFEWTHRHFPNFLDCRPIFVRRMIEDAGFHIAEASLEHMWIPVEVVLSINEVVGTRQIS